MRGRLNPPSEGSRAIWGCHSHPELPPGAWPTEVSAQVARCCQGCGSREVLLGPRPSTFLLYSLVWLERNFTWNPKKGVEGSFSETFPSKKSTFPLNPSLVVGQAYIHSWESSPPQPGRPRLCGLLTSTLMGRGKPKASLISLLCGQPVFYFCLQGSF